jgi:hypothetical protein
MRSQSYVVVNDQISRDPEFGQVWVDSDNKVVATLDLGGLGYVGVHSVSYARKLAQAAIRCADAMEARQQQLEDEYAAAAAAAQRQEEIAR